MDSIAALVLHTVGIFQEVLTLNQVGQLQALLTDSMLPLQHCGMMVDHLPIVEVKAEVWSLIQQLSHIEPFRCNKEKQNSQLITKFKCVLTLINKL